MSELYRNLRQVICELELVSHAGAANYDFAAPPKGRSIRPGKWGQGGVNRKGSSESRGGDSPGGINKAQREEDFYRDDEPDETRPERLLRSAEPFKRRIRAAEKAEAPDAVFAAILTDAEAAIATWKRAPIPDHPPMADPMWKEWVRATDLSTSDIAREYSVTARYIRRIRAEKPVGFDGRESLHQWQDIRRA